MKKIIRNIVLVGIVALLCMAAYKQLEKNKDKIEADAQLSQQRNDVIPVITGKVTKDTMGSSFELVGSFAPFKQVTLTSEVPGKAKGVEFENGSVVKTGKILVSIDNDLLKIQHSTTEINLAKAENDLRRLTNLLGDGGITEQQVEEAQLAVDNLKSQIKSLDKQISMTYVTAPISGVITNKQIEQGSMVSPSMPIAMITNISKLKMQVHLTEEQVVTINEGDKVRITADILPNKNLWGKVTFIDVMAGQGKRYLVDIEFPNNANKLKAGMTGTAFFSGGEKSEVLAVPRASIVGDLKNAKVYVVDGEKAVLKEVEVGKVFGNNIQIKKGLEPGETVVVSGQINLEDGMTISISNQKI
ncbi:MAG: efflux RND transporter periplasmic adaptor subunit [Bacteroidota bacterium]